MFVPPRLPYEPVQSRLVPTYVSDERLLAESWPCDRKGNNSLTPCKTADTAYLLLRERYNYWISYTELATKPRPYTGDGFYNQEVMYWPRTCSYSQTNTLIFRVILYCSSLRSIKHGVQRTQPAGYILKTPTARLQWLTHVNLRTHFRSFHLYVWHTVVACKLKKTEEELNHNYTFAVPYILCDMFRL